ncbi:transglycosylase SLT domain-containing protein [Fibrella forsythiae]|uniref:Transglycosylase SLT domain-containing protein n=1 Tax=Fibrella forsythiae TaxID=2817061 RepID=A0ABS3JAH5_9BACT|nr:transglycosylase SLT domain-containing protein [Fibrella forsythiae]MBO0946999.1 transglycosylase SLT domain-containing protein [Fibrella forsythiae]
MKLPYQDRIGPQLLAAIIDLSQWLGIRPAWLLIIMFKESGLNPKAVNKYSGASGLIQFMPGTAKGLGTSVEHIRTLTGLQQMEWVRKYFTPYRGRMHSLWDTYFAVFYPAAIGKPAEHVLFAAGTKAYKWNAGMDMNKNGKVTVSDVKVWLMRYLPDEYDPCDCDCH